MATDQQVTTNKFQSTPLCSGDWISVHIYGSCRIFQSTPLCSGDPQTQINGRSNTNFNPRHYAVATQFCDKREDYVHISIHATMQWRRVQPSSHLLLVTISIHATMQWRQYEEPVKWYIAIFQSTPLCSGDAEAILDILDDAKFQSTPLCSGD